MTDEFLVLSFDKIWKLVYSLHEKIIASGYKTDIIIGIARGGLVVARILSDLLEKKLVTIGIDFYKGINETKNEPFLFQELNYNIKGKNILLVDDVADTGNSLVFAHNYFQEKQPKEVRIATIHYKPHSKIIPDFYISKTSAWIVYPWEYLEFAKLFVQRQLKERKPLVKIEAILKKLEIPDEIIKITLKK